MGLKVKIVNATFEAIIPGPRGRQVRPRRFVVHRHQGAREDRRLRRPTSRPARRSTTKAQGGATINSARRPVRPHGRGREGHHRAGRRRRRRARSARPTASRRSTCSASPTRTAPTWRSSSGRAEIGMADSPVAEYQVKKSNGQFKLLGRRYGTAPYGIAIPKNSGHGQADARGAQGADGRTAPTRRSSKKWGVEAGAITQPGRSTAPSARAQTSGGCLEVSASELPAGRAA